jgi:hypothetical protein
MAWLSTVSQDSWDNTAIFGGCMVAIGVGLEILPSVVEKSFHLFEVW